MIVREKNLPREGDELDVMLAWLSDEEVDLTNKKFILRHTTREVSAYVTEVNYLVDVNTLHRDKDVKKIGLNSIVRAQIKTAQPLYFDSYRANRSTGSFILIDTISNNTVAAGMINGSSSSLPNGIGGEEIKSKNIKEEDSPITLESIEEKNGHKGCVIWFTGLSGSGKSTVSKSVMSTLFDMGCQVTMLDGDNVRHGLNKDLGFSAKDRKENIRRVGEVAKLFAESGSIVLCSFISPYAEDRDGVRKILKDGQFVEVFVDCNLEVCKKRDPKGLYEKVEKGEIRNFTGIDAPYEVPRNPELVIETDVQSVEESKSSVVDKLRDLKVLR